MEEIAGMPKKAPDLLIYLRGPLETHLDRIRKRGRPYEQVEGDPGLLDYYKILHNHYDDWFKSYDQSPTLVINIDQFDLEEEEDQKAVMAMVRDKLKDIGAD